MKGLIIIPAYNEEESIIKTIRDIRNTCNQYDIVVINDCSKDKTEELLKENNINHISLPINLGIGGAVQTGYKYAKKHGYDYAVQVDADGQHDVAYLSSMQEQLERTKADMIIGSRFIEKEGFQSSFLRRLGIKYFTFLIKLLTGVTITDPTSGLRMVGRKAIELFALDYPNDYPEPETSVALISRGYKVVEMPVIMKNRQGGKSSISPMKSVYYMMKVSLSILVEVSRGKGFIWKH